MKSLRYWLLKKKPYNFEDLKHFCENKELPKEVSAKLVIHKRKRRLYDSYWKEIYVNYNFSGDNNFSFERFYGVFFDKEMVFIYDPQEDLNKLKGLKIKTNICKRLSKVVDLDKKKSPK